jgi:predicted amidohydrolase YtcJ
VIAKIVALSFAGILLSACSEGGHGPTTEQPEAPTGSLTSVFVNGDIITVNPAQPSAEAVAVRNGKILAVGARHVVEAAAGNNIELRDLQGHTLLPGFIDAHGHFSGTGQIQMTANIASPPVGPVQDIAGLLEALKAHAEKMPGAGAIMGVGYDDSLLAEGRHPTREELDEVSTSMPVVISHVSGHLMSCNSLCLELSGITAETPDPKGGHIRRAQGSKEPNGVLEETAMYGVRRILLRPDVETQVQLLQKAQAEYASYGLTTIQDGATRQDNLAVLASAAEQGALYLDVVSYPYYTLGIDGLKQHPPSPQYNNNYRIGGLKITLDGSPQGKTAWLTQAYFHPPHGQPQDYKGYPILADDKLEPLVDYAIENDIQLLMHANGDAAADQMIQTLKKASNRHGKAATRPVMIHAQTAREDQIDAMLEQGIIPSYFVAHTFYWGDWHRDSVFGEQRASRISPLRSSADKGLLYTIHNDTPVVPADMMRLLWTAVNRVTRSGKVLGEEQRATVMEAIRAMTLDAAYQYFEEDSKGSIEAGKRADLVILEQNPLQIDPMNIKDIAVLETIKDGQVVFRR